MDREERKAGILEFRNKDVVGKFVILRPASVKYAEDIVNLRNKPRNMYVFNQSYLLTTEDQTRWFEKYEKTSNDIYWCILDKAERFIGTIRLYGIDPAGEYCEEGSYVIDEDVVDEAPYAVESKMLALDVAFDDLQIKTMINEVRVENKNMNNIDNQLGFTNGIVTQIRGVDFRRRELSSEDYRKNRNKFSRLVDYWSCR